MIKYIIITPRVCSMGGAQLYVLRRANYLINLGYDVHIIVGDHGENFPLRDKFNGIKIHCVPEILQRIAQVSIKKQEKVLNALEEKIGMGDEYLVESHDLTTIEWGEVLSAKLGAKHLAYPLAEPRVRKYKFLPGMRIFKEKLANGEFYGCSSLALSEIFQRIDVPNNFVNIAYDESELANISTPSVSFIKNPNDYVITTITRLDKTYIEPLSDAVAEMARKYEMNRFVLLIIGGSTNKKREQYLKENYNNETYKINNLEIKYLGYINKLGKDIYKVTDAFIGMGTASINAISQKCITINVDPRNGMKQSSGVFGVDTQNFAYSENGRLYELFAKIEEVFLYDKRTIESIRETGRKLFEEEFEMGACFKKLDSAFVGIKPVRDRDSLSIPHIYRYLVMCLFAIKKIIEKSQ